MASKESIFRAAALERLSSPERLDTLVRIVDRKLWLPLAATGLLVAAGVAWGLLGRIPITALGRGVLLRPRTVRAVQAPSAGLLVAFGARDGDLVRRGETLGTIDQYELRQKLEQEQRRRTQIESQRASASELEKKSDELELGIMKQQRARLEARIVEREELAAKQARLDESALAQERRSLAERLATGQQIVAAAKRRVEVYRKLGKEGAAREDEALDAERTHIEAQNRVLDIERDVQQTTLREAENVRLQQEKLDRIAQLKDQIAELDLKASRLQRQELESQAAFERESGSADGAIAALELSLARQGQVVSDCDGRFLEISATIGQQVTQGARLALVEEGDPTRELVCVAYVPVKDGKRLRVGGLAQVEPDTVQRERYGGILGRITAVSPFPVTAEAAGSLIGSADVTKDVIGEGSRIQVTVELTADAGTASGYAWSSSRGPDLKPTAGTAAHVRLGLEERAPITYVLPSLREILGLE